MGDTDLLWSHYAGGGPHFAAALETSKLFTVSHWNCRRTCKTQMRRSEAQKRAQKTLLSCTANVQIRDLRFLQAFSQALAHRTGPTRAKTQVTQRFVRA
jgi:hypothetical protein